MATAVFNATVCTSTEPVGGDTPWVSPSEAQSTDDGTGASALLDPVTTFTEKLQAAFATSSLSILTVQAIQVRIKKSYFPTGLGIAPTDAGVYLTISGSDSGTDKSTAVDWPVGYDTYGDTVSDIWGIGSSSLRNALAANTLGVGIRAVNNNTDIAALTAFVFEFELTVTYIPRSGAPQMALMGVGI